MVAVDPVRLAPRPETPEDIRAHPGVPPDKDVLDDAEALEQSDALKSSSDPASGERV